MCVCRVSYIWRTFLLRFLPTTTAAIKTEMTTTTTTRNYSRCVSCTMMRSTARVTVMVPATVWPSDIRIVDTESLTDRRNGHRTAAVRTITRLLVVRQTARERDREGKNVTHTLGAASTTQDYITRRIAARRLVRAYETFNRPPYVTAAAATAAATAATATSCACVMRAPRVM